MTDCIEAEGWMHTQGYRSRFVWVGGREYSIRQHRMAYELANGPIPDGLFVCHTCDNPGCVNVKHLFLGTALDNNRDKVAKNRGRNGYTTATHCVWGHEFTEENTYYQPGMNKRACRACNARRSLEKRARQ